MKLLRIVGVVGYAAPVTVALSDILAGTTCVICPGTIPWGPGWYLVAENHRVEAGPFLTEDTAHHASSWLEDESLGVHPGPYVPRFSRLGLLIGSRIRDRRGSLQRVG